MSTRPIKATQIIVLLLTSFVWPVIATQRSCIAQQSSEDSLNIQAWIAQLGSPKFQERDRATRNLLRAGQPAVPALRKATSDPDRERALRARFVLTQILNVVDIKELQGTWKYVSIQLSGESETPGGRLTIDGNSMKIHKRGGGDPYGVMTFAIDAGQTPKQLDFQHENSIIKGIYQVDGDKLTLCYPFDRDGPRPTKLKTTDGDGIRLFVLERIRP